MGKIWGKKRPTGKGGKDLRKEKGEALFRGERVGRISTGKGGNNLRNLTKEREKIWEKRT